MSSDKSKPWWSYKYGKDKICAITKTRLRPGKDRKGNSYSIFLKCGHGFSRSALEKFISIAEKASCPLCRRCFDPKLKYI